ncbi:VQ motif-containing protein 17 [Linum perenne]
MKKPNHNSPPAAAQSSSSSSSPIPSPPGLSFHRVSRPLTKPPPSTNAVTKKPPKIRIIHIFAPEIIKTDVANFRELVQRLTGKPTVNDGHVSERKKRKSKSKQLPPPPNVNDETNGRYSDENDSVCYPYHNGGFLGVGSWFDATTVKEENRIEWPVNQDGRTGCGYFEEIDGFIQELGAEFPLVEPNHHFQQQRNFGFGEATQFA